MADEIYPLPRFHFVIDWDGTQIGCSEITGLNAENQPIEYRDGAYEKFSMRKMPGLQKFGDIVMKKAIFASNSDYYDWFSTVNMNTIDRKPVTISLLDEEHNPVMTWKLNDAWPSKIDSPEMKADANEVAVESITIVCEGMEIEVA